MRLKTATTPSLEAGSQPVIEPGITQAPTSGTRQLTDTTSPLPESSAVISSSTWLDQPAFQAMVRSAPIVKMPGPPVMPEGAVTSASKAVDTAWKDVEREVLWLDAYIPQAGVTDADALMREWVGTRERLDRFKRTLRLLAGEPTVTAQR